MTTEVTPQDYELNVRLTATPEQAEQLATELTVTHSQFSPSVLVQPVQDSPELPDHTTLLVPTDALTSVREQVTVMTSSDPYSEEYERALSHLLPALHSLLGIVTETTPESVAAAASREPEQVEVNW